MKKNSNLNTKMSDLIIRPKSLTVRFKSYGPRNRLPKARVRRYRQRLHVDVLTHENDDEKRLSREEKLAYELKQETFRGSWAGLGWIGPGLAGSGLGRCWLACAGRAWAAYWVPCAPGARLGASDLGAPDAGLAEAGLAGS